MVEQTLAENPGAVVEALVPAVLAVVGQEINRAFGDGADPDGPAAADDLSGLGLPERALGRIREIARERVEARRRAMKGVMAMQQRRDGYERPSLAVVEARRQLDGRMRTRRFSSGARAFLEARDGVPDAASGVQEAVVGPDRRTRAQRHLDERLRPQAPSDELGGRVVDMHGSGVVEAAVAEVPPAQRGWREALSRRGFSAELIERMERAGGDAA
jgi:hypothetical protein